MMRFHKSRAGIISARKSAGLFKHRNFCGKIILLYNSAGGAGAERNPRMDFEERTLKSETVYQGRIISLKKDAVSLPNGHEATREVVEHPGGVCVAPLTADGSLIFVRQFRYPFHEVVLELPAGKLDRKGEDPLEGGIRELKEETGATAKSYVSLGRMYSTPGFCNEILYLYLAQELDYGPQQPDEDELLDVVKIPLDETVRMVMAGEIPDAKTQVAVLKTALYLKDSKNK
jgi:ADP-ribose pyrophosphatase